MAEKISQPTSKASGLAKGQNARFASEAATQNYTPPTPSGAVEHKFVQFCVQLNYSSCRKYKEYNYNFINYSNNENNYNCNQRIYRHTCVQAPAI